jgi:adenosylhomocysteine nucleosidase
VTTVGIIAAMRSEARPLLRLLRDHGPVRRGGRGLYTFQAGATRCILVVSGMGWEPARRATASLLEFERPEAILSFGIAGAVGDQLAIGDVVAGECSRALCDGRLEPPRPLGRIPEPVHAVAAGAAAARGARYCRATVVTVRGLHPVDLPRDETAVVEMETAAIAAESAARGIPLLSFRAVSDSSRAPVPFEMSGGDEFRLRPLALLGAIVRRPRILGPLFRLARNSAGAARTLAAVVFAVLSSGAISHYPV